MSMISDLTPTNLVAEKQKFFANFDYNPQLTYTRTFSPQDLTRWGLPQKNYFEAVSALLNKHPFTNPPITITQRSQVEQRVQQLLADLHLQQPLEIQFSDLLISRCSINSQRIVFRLPISFSEEDFAGLLNHEIQTHFLRRVNNHLQPWHLRERTDHQVEHTEEGLANLHSFVEQSDGRMRRSWLNYCAIYLSQKLSFSDVFKTLLSYGVDVDRAWYATIRTKRGLVDTSVPGGNTKGLVYLEGAVKVWHWLMDPEHDPRDLYLGRISLDEIEDRKREADIRNITYPLFFTDIAKYRQRIHQIGTENKLDLL